MDVSILEHEHILIVNIQSALADNELTALEKLIITKATNPTVKGVVLNVEGLNVIDSFATRIFEAISDTLRNMGKSMVAVNLKSSVSFVMKQIGINAFSFKVVEDLEAGVIHIHNRNSHPTLR